MSSLNSVTGTSLALLPGMIVTLEVENTFANQGPILHDGEQRTLIRGFFSENEEIGTIMEAEGEAGAIVKYKHLKSLSNRVWFYGRCGEVGMFSVVYVPIHDHASLVTGGPAFATYASEPTIQTTEEGS